MNKKLIMPLVISLIFVNACREPNKHQKNLIGKWEMVEKKYQCSDTLLSNRLNSYSDVEKFIFDFSSSAMKSFGHYGLLDSMRYELEGDSLILFRDKEYIISYHLNFISAQELIMTKKRKDEDSNCVLTAIFKRVNTAGNKKDSSVFH